MSISVHSEIGRLRKVLLHRPGKELEHLVPDELSRLLFDDIPYLKAARQEHDFFAELLRGNDVEVVYLEDLAAQTLETDDGLRREFVRQFVSEGGPAAQRYKRELTDMLLDLDARDMVLKAMAGVSTADLGHAVESSPFSVITRSRDRFILDPIPNLYFQRDPFACIGRGVSLNSMYSVTRRRETIFGEYILKYHPNFKGTPLYYDRSAPFSIEGGDIMILGDKTIAVGISQRTMPEGVELLAKNIFSDEQAEIERIIAIEIPAVRAFMHLDTVFTQIDYDKFIFYPGILDTLRIFEITPAAKGEMRVRERELSLEDVLKECLGLDSVTLIPCGGGDRAASEREQWNDGSNALCIRPGTIIAYERNYVTNDLLIENGVNVLKTPSSELSRGRGGPRCMSMPLVRDELLPRVK